MLKLITNLAKLESLKTEWKNFPVVKEYPLLSFEWIYCCYKHFYDENDIRLFCFIKGKNIEAAAPLVLVKENGTQYFEFVGASLLYEPVGFLYKNEAAFQLLINELLRLKIPIILTRIYNTFEKFLWDKSNLRFKGFIKKVNTSGTPIISTKDDWDKYINSISSRRKYDIRRAEKKANDIGNMDYEIISNTSEKFDGYIQKAFEIENSGWKGKSGSSILKKKHFKEFFSEYLFQASKNDIIHLFFLKINMQYAAMMICLIYAKKLWVLKIGYDEKYAICSPGILLLYHAIQYTFEQDLEAMELLGTEADWLKVWSSEIREYQTNIIYPLSYNGLSLLIQDGFKYFTKNLKRIFN